MRKAGWGFLLLVLLLAGCGSPGEAPVPTALPTREINAVVTQTRTSIPTSGFEITNTAAPAAAPTETPAPTGGSTPTAAPVAATSTPLPATVSAAATLDAVPLPCGEDKRIQERPLIESVSPNGKWAAYQCASSSLGRYVSVQALDSPIRYRASFTETYAAAPGTPDGDTVLTLPSFWSPDGRALYLRTFFPEMSSGDTDFTDGHGLFRLSLLGGSLAQILPPISGAEGYALRISPDGRSLAYAQPWQPAAIHIRDLSTGRESIYTIDAKFSKAGFFAWADDGQKLAFTAAVPDAQDPEAFSGFTIFLLDLRRHLLEALYSAPPPVYRVAQWTSPTELRFTVTDAGTEAPELIYDLISRSLSNP